MFEIADAARQRRLRDVEPLGGALEIEFFGDGDKIR
jgi:hypothetical protein